jgi:cytochrome c biogenesis protein CcmG/thiol:disulfide interchange protein DsbE
MSRALRVAPLLLVVAVLAVFVWRLASPADSTIESRLVGQRVPIFELPAAVPGKPALASSDLDEGRPRLLNIFASWCVPCIDEAPLLAELQRRGVLIDGIAIRDRPQDITAFLGRYGDPFTRIGSDENSRVQLALGSSGVPETFIVDGRGVIRHHHVGPLQPSDLPMLMAELEKAR